mmetsp:Transcript_41422/g.110514  ORF Transcript_41422/g.110514 Transcript_41422/m.110514 type:complete len:722 (-) Transcript_41422:100-2265(-)
MRANEEKAGNLVLQCLQRVVEIVLLCRVPKLGNGASSQKLQLELEELPFVGDTIRNHWTRNFNAPLLLHIYSQKPGAPPYLLEQWVLQYEPQHSSGMRQTDVLSSLTKAYKKIVVMLRTLYSFCRIVPGHQFYKKSVQSSSCGFSMEFKLFTQRAVGKPWELVRCSSADRDATVLEFTDPGAVVAAHEVPPISTPYGHLKIRALYRRDTAAQLEDPQPAILDEHQIIKDYVGEEIPEVGGAAAEGGAGADARHGGVAAVAAAAESPARMSGLGNLLQKDSASRTLPPGSGGAAHRAGATDPHLDGPFGDPFQPAHGGGGSIRHGESVPSRPIEIPWDRRTSLDLRSHFASPPDPHPASFDLYSKSEGSGRSRLASAPAAADPHHLRHPQQQHLHQWGIPRSGEGLQDPRLYSKTVSEAAFPSRYEAAQQHPHPQHPQHPQALYHQQQPPHGHQHYQAQRQQRDSRERLPSDQATPPTSTPPFLPESAGTSLPSNTALHLDQPAISCSPPFSPAAPMSLLSTSPQQFAMGQHPYTAASLLSTSRKGGSQLLAENREVQLQTLPESPFQTSGYDHPSAGDLGHDLDVLPATAHSILANLHGHARSDVDDAPADQFAHSPDGQGAFAFSAHHESPNPPTAPGVVGEAIDPSQYLAYGGGTTGNLEESGVSSFVHLCQTAPDLQLYQPTPPQVAPAGTDPGTGGLAASTIEDELREFRSFSLGLA